LALALAARPRHAKETLLEANLASTPAGRAGLGRCTGLRAGAAARAANTVPRNLDFFLNATDGFFEFEAQVIAQVLAARPTAGSTAAEELAEYVAEHILETARKIKSPGKRTTFAKSRMPELVILRTLLRI
jgi:hypothetical protein